uniref:Cytochrome b561 domain-containing protein n=1 Tax=Ditylenchus dipsaci TaxID=166011 RepID=A0A915EMF9_9BILA
MTFKTNGASVIPAFFQNGKDVFFNADKLSDDQHFQAIQQRSLRYFDFVVVLCQLAQITMIGLADLWRISSHEIHIPLGSRQSRTLGQLRGRRTLSVNGLKSSPLRKKKGSKRHRPIHPSSQVVSSAASYPSSRSIQGVSSASLQQQFRLQPCGPRSRSSKKLQKSIVSYVYVTCIVSFVYGTAQGGELNWTNAQLTNTQNAVNINFHALLLTTAILFCQGDGLLSLRLYRHEVKWVARVVNGLLHTLTLLLTAGGIAVIVVETNLGYQFSFSSQLSWLQLLIMIGQMVYTVVGVVCFWFPRCSPQVLGLVVPVQRAAGITLFLLNVGFLLAGIVEYKSALGDCYFKLTCPKKLGLLLNLKVMAALCYGICVCALLRSKKWRRESTTQKHN